MRGRNVVVREGRVAAGEFRFRARVGRRRIGSDESRYETVGTLFHVINKRSGFMG